MRREQQPVRNKNERDKNLVIGGIHQRARASGADHDTDPIFVVKSCVRLGEASCR